MPKKKAEVEKIFEKARNSYEYKREGLRIQITEAIAKAMKLRNITCKELDAALGCKTKKILKTGKISFKEMVLIADYLKFEWKIDANFQV